MESALNLTVIIKHSSISYWRRSVCVCVLGISFQMCSERKVFKINLRLPAARVVGWTACGNVLKHAYLHRPDPCVRGLTVYKYCCLMYKCQHNEPIMVTDECDSSAEEDSAQLVVFCLFSYTEARLLSLYVI